MSENARYISFISNPQFWATIRAIHNHMLAEKLDEWGYKKITRLGEILEGKYSDHLTEQHRQDEIAFRNLLDNYIKVKVDEAIAQSVNNLKIVKGE